MGRTPEHRAKRLRLALMEPQMYAPYYAFQATPDNKITFTIRLNGKSYTIGQPIATVEEFRARFRETIGQLVESNAFPDLLNAATKEQYYEAQIKELEPRFESYAAPRLKDARHPDSLITYVIGDARNEYTLGDAVKTMLDLVRDSKVDPVRENGLEQSKKEAPPFQPRHFTVTTAPAQCTLTFFDTRSERQREVRLCFDDAPDLQTLETQLATLLKRVGLTQLTPEEAATLTDEPFTNLFDDKTLWQEAPDDVVRPDLRHEGIRKPAPNYHHVEGMGYILGDPKGKVPAFNSTTHYSPILQPPEVIQAKARALAESNNPPKTTITQPSISRPTPQKKPGYDPTVKPPRSKGFGIE